MLATLVWAPFILVDPAVGVWVDRLRRRPVTIAADVRRPLALMIVPIAALMRALRFETVHAPVSIAGMLTAFFDVAYASH